MNDIPNGVIDQTYAFYMEDMRAFHERFSLLPEPDTYLEKHATFRQNFLLEELNELSTAFAKGDLVSYLDALVDLDYVALGTAFLMGQYPVFVMSDPTQVFMNHLQKDRFRGHALAAPQPPIASQYVFFLGSIYTQLGSAFHSVMMARRGGSKQELFTRASLSLRDMHRTIIDHSFLCGLDFVEAWERVHRANMSKVRAEKTGDSKRGSTFDVVKPSGWTAPDLTDLVGDPAHDLPPFLLERSPSV